MSTRNASRTPRSGSGITARTSPQARELADRFFFETLVRLHRAGEGASFTGLKAVGRDLGPAIPAADKAVHQESIEPVVKLLTETMEERLREHFNRTVTAKGFDTDDVTAGPEYVKAYVEFIHYVERLYDASTASAHSHFSETEAAAHDRSAELPHVLANRRGSG